MSELNEAALTKGVANTLDALLPPNRGFYILTFEKAAWGEFSGMGSGDMETQIMNLRAAADGLEKRLKERQRQGVAA